MLIYSCTAKIHNLFDDTNNCIKQFQKKLPGLV